MSNFQLKLIIVCLVAIILLMTGSECRAGLFLDLDLGGHLNDYHEHSTTNPARNYLSHENPIGIYRIGYQTKPVNLVWKIKIRGHGYYEHGSSVKSRTDYGYDLGMIGVRFEL